MELFGTMIFLGLIGFIIYCFFVYRKEYKSIQEKIEDGDLIEEVAMDDDLILVEEGGIRAMMSVEDAELLKSMPRIERRNCLRDLAKKRKKITSEEALLKAQQIRDGYKKEI